jgi:hypothetical protein
MGLHKTKKLLLNKRNGHIRVIWGLFNAIVIPGPCHRAMSQNVSGTGIVLKLLR